MDFTNMTMEELRNFASAIKEELEQREWDEVNQAIEDFKRAFNRLRELRIDIRYSSNDWDDDAEYLRDWEGFDFY